MKKWVFKGPKSFSNASKLPYSDTPFATYNLLPLPSKLCE